MRHRLRLSRRTSQTRQAGASLAESLLAVCALSLFLMAGSRTFSGSVNHSYCRASAALSLAGQDGGGTDEATEGEDRERTTPAPPPRRLTEKEMIERGTLSCVENLKPRIARQGGGFTGAQ
jgi:hypothetical protein